MKAEPRLLTMAEKNVRVTDPDTGHRQEQKEKGTNSVLKSCLNISKI